MNISNQALVIEADIDKAIQEITDVTSLAVRKNLTPTSTSMYGNKEAVFGPPISIYGSVKFAMTEEDIIEKELNADMSVSTTSLCLYNNGLLDSEHMPTLTVRDSLEHKGKTYNILKIVPKSPFENIFLKFNIICKEVKKV